VAALVNPHRADCTSGATDLAAVGIAFFFCGALRKALVAAGRLASGAVDLRPLLDLVAVGTIADMVPLTGDNRALVTAGLRLLNESPRVGLAALKAVASLNGREATAGTVSFAIAPRLNATGRMRDPRASLDLLLARDPEEAKRHADVLDRENDERRRVEAEVVADALARIEAAGGPAHRVIVVASDGWHPGVVGIVASRLVEAFRRPAIVIGLAGATGRGSCRSVRGFDMGAALARLSDLLVRHGGHPMAAGLTIETARLDAFRSAFEALADRDVPEEALLPVVDVDATIGLADVDLALCEELRRLAPFGIGNPEPVFAALGVTVAQCRRIGEDQSHAMFTFQDGAIRMPGVWFRCGDRVPAPGDVVDIAFHAGVDDRSGAPRLRLKDVRSRLP
jgi:single-stranded-DNA-specific exonuclease